MRFCITFFNIIIECDRDYWHANPKIYNRKKLDSRQKRKVQIDKYKTKYLAKKGWTVFRFYESDIKKNIKDCMNEILIEIRKELKQIKNPLDNL